MKAYIGECDRQFYSEVNWIGHSRCVDVTYVQRNHVGYKYNNKALLRQLQLYYMPNGLVEVTVTDAS